MENVWRVFFRLSFLIPGSNSPLGTDTDRTAKGIRKTATTISNWLKILIYSKTGSFLKTVSTMLPSERSGNLYPRNASGAADGGTETIMPLNIWGESRVIKEFKVFQEWLKIRASLKEKNMDNLKTKTIITSIVNILFLLFGTKLGLTDILAQVGISQEQVALTLIALAQVFQRWNMKK